MKDVDPRVFTRIVTDGRTDGSVTTCISPSNFVGEGITKRGNSHFNTYLRDFNVKRIKSKIDKYKINNNNTSTKHEFKVKYEGN